MQLYNVHSRVVDQAFEVFPKSFGAGNGWFNSAAEAVGIAQNWFVRTIFRMAELVFKSSILRDQTLLKLILPAIMVFGACASPKSDLQPTLSQEDEAESSVDSELESNGDGYQLQVVGVEASGEPGAYSLAVTLSSPDTGCSQYANWWEVVVPPDRLVYRRILAHSHVSEQPFTRSGGPVAIAADEIVIVRGHMNTFGYGPIAMQGSVAQGFESMLMDSNAEPLVDPAIEKQEPQPNTCEF